jgi:superfamily I DNA/RNA helicase
VTGLDGEADTLTGYRSPLHGRRPTIVAARTREAEHDALVRHVTAWREEGIEPHAIGIAARSSRMGKEAAAALSAAGIPTVPLSAESSKDAVRAGTMHGMKGLEFQAVAVIGVADGTVPAPSALTDAADDPVAYAQDLQRERCLLFVALTRARDHLLHLLQRLAQPVPRLEDQNRSAERSRALPQRTARWYVVQMASGVVGVGGWRVQI